MFFKFRRMRAMDPLQVAMTGVRMGERYLQVFCSDTALTQGLATKSGLSGVAMLVASNEAQAERARRAAAKAGALIDVQVGDLTTLPRPAELFDMIVIDNSAASFTELADTVKGALLHEAREVLRPGGRVELIERISTAAGQSETALRAAGLRPVRVLAERDDFRFIEALKG